MNSINIKSLLKERILVLDGAMGSLLQEYKLEEPDFRSERFANHEFPLKGALDVLCLTQPEIIVDIHRKYLAAGRGYRFNQYFQRYADWLSRIRFRRRYF